MSGKPQRALIIFARHPTPGRVKTRLSPPLTAAEAAELYRCMLLDILEKTERLVGTERFIFYEDEPGAADFFRRQAAAEIFPQRGKDLGERMAAAFACVLSRGFTQAAIIGTDSPDLPLAFIEEAFARLEDAGTDAVFGPAEDGGYYLLALKRLHRELFRDIPWSSGDVLAQSLERCAASGIGVSLVPGWYDIDTAADLRRPGLAEANGAPRTGEFIRRWLAPR